MKTDIDSLREKILKESKEYVSQPKQADEFTVKDFQQISGVGADRARDALDRMEKDGKVLRRKSGARVYWSFEKKSKKSNV
jgi:predicted transcriptional regulator of viral defense system